MLAAASTTPNAGAADNLTVTAKDSAGNTVSAYTGSHNLTFAGASAIGSYNPTVANSSGTADQLRKRHRDHLHKRRGHSLRRLERRHAAVPSGVRASITVAEGGSYTSNAVSVTVSPLAISTLSLAAATTTPNAGAADNLTITALGRLRQHGHLLHAARTT